MLALGYGAGAQPVNKFCHVCYSAVFEVSDLAWREVCEGDGVACVRFLGDVCNTSNVEEFLIWNRDRLKENVGITGKIAAWLIEYTQTGPCRSRCI